MIDIWNYIQHHWFQIISWMGDLVLIESVIKSVAQKRGYSQLVTLCDRFANVLNFLFDIINGVLSIITNKGRTSNVQKEPIVTTDSDVVKPDTGESGSKPS